MTEKIREYNMNGVMIIGIDHGYGNIKSARRVFPTGVIKSESAPIFSKDYIEYDGKFYIIGEGHKSFVAEKQADKDNFILTMAAIAKELEVRWSSKIVTLPLKYFLKKNFSFQTVSSIRYKSVV